MNHAGVAFYQQSQVVIADLGHVHGLQAWSQQAEAGQAGQRAFAVLLERLLHLEGGFMHVHVDRGVEFFGDDADFLQVFITNGIGRMRAEGYPDAWVMLEVAEQLDGLAQGFIGAGGPGNREIEDGHGDLRADAAVVHALAGNFRVEVHVRKTADTALDLFGDGQVGTVADEVLADPFALGRPDVLLQPGHQWQVVGKAAEQGHGGMPVGVDQAWGEQCSRQFADFAGHPLQGFGARADKGDASVADAQAMLPQHDAGRFHGHQPGGQQQQVERGGDVWHRGRLPGFMHIFGTAKYTRAPWRGDRYNRRLFSLSAE